MYYPTIKIIKVDEPYKVHIEFDDGVTGDIIFEDSFFSGTLHEPLKDFRLFSTVVEDELGMLMWDNGYGLSVRDLHDYFENKMAKHEAA